MVGGGGAITCVTPPYWVSYTSTWGVGAAIAPALGPPGPYSSMGMVSVHWPVIHMGRDTSSTTSCSVRMRWGRGWWVHGPGASTAGQPPRSA